MSALIATTAGTEASMLLRQLGVIDINRVCGWIRNITGIPSEDDVTACRIASLHDFLDNAIATELKTVKASNAFHEWSNGDEKLSLYVCQAIPRQPGSDRDEGTWLLEAASLAMQVAPTSGLPTDLHGFILVAALGLRAASATQDAVSMPCLFA
jgi:hypothetical protein